jgi:hypothetical protein
MKNPVSGLQLKLYRIGGGEKMTEKKDSNPKRAMAVKKVSMHVVPVKPLLEVALALTEGGHKYGTHNYRDIGVRSSTYYGATLRHLFAYWEGEDIDPESGVHHVIKAIASMFVLRDSQHMGNCTDDRPIRYPNGINMVEFNEIAEMLLKMYPESAVPFLEATHGVPKPPEEIKQGCDACTLTDSRPPHCAKDCSKAPAVTAPAVTSKENPVYRTGDKVVVCIDDGWEGIPDIQAVVVRYDCDGYYYVNIKGKPLERVHENGMESEQNYTERRSNKNIPEVKATMEELKTGYGGPLYKKGDLIIVAVAGHDRQQGVYVEPHPQQGMHHLTIDGEKYLLASGDFCHVDELTDGRRPVVEPADQKMGKVPKYQKGYRVMITLRSDTSNQVRNKCKAARFAGHYDRLYDVSSRLHIIALGFHGTVNLYEDEFTVVK